jgi:hypothetical protein
MREWKHTFLRLLSCHLMEANGFLQTPAAFFRLAAAVDGLISQDGVPANFCTIVRTSLDEPFPGREISKGGSINWPPRSSDLTSIDVFWKYIKDIVHSERMDSLPDLRRRTAAAIAAVPVDVLSRVWGEVEFRFDVCRAANGVHNELH